MRASLHTIVHASLAGLALGKGFDPRYGTALERHKHFFIGANTGEPGHDPVDLEWDSDFVEAGDAVCPAALQAKIQEEDYLISQSETFLPNDPKRRMINFNTEELVLSGKTIPVGQLLRSGGYPMCPNYWDDKWDDDVQSNPLPDHYAAKEGFAVSMYKYPSKTVGSPYKGDPELSFCRRVQYEREATCCIKMLDDDIQEEYEELTGGGYLQAHVFLQQFMCLPCHPMVSCMINEAETTLNIPLEFAKRLAAKMHDFDRTGLKIKTGELVADDGPLRQDELYLPLQVYGKDNNCECTSVKNCECIKKFLMATRPPSINDYDGTALTINITEGDACGVLGDMLPGSKVASGAVRAVLSTSAMVAGLICVVLAVGHI